MATMNINEQMNQLGQIGSSGYDPADSVVDQLVGRAKRARAIRQGAAGLIGSVGAIGLGLLGAQVFVNLTQDNDPATIADRGFDFNSMEWGDRYGDDYTGLGKTQDELAQAWEDLKAAAAVKTDEPAPAPAKTEKPAVTCEYETKTKDGWIYYRSTATGCEWVKKEKVEITVPAGSIEFGGIIAPCKNYYDAATDSTVWAAFIDAGESWKKIVKCEGGPTDYWSGSYRYIYGGGAGGGWHATLSGATCTGFEWVNDGKVYQYICNPNYGSYEFPWKYIRDVTPTPTPTETPEPEPEPEPTI
ncbi:MAG: hypothetical protein JW722_02400 [Demequinaceae bacterium]|nr:hypothetical protein [Demequinaceae bacterium]